MEKRHIGALKSGVLIGGEHGALSGAGGEESGGSGAAGFGLSYRGVRQALHLQEEIAWFENQWDRVAAEFDPQGDWLPTPQTASDYCRWIGMDEELARSVVQGVHEVRAQPALVMLTWQYYSAMFGPAAIRPFPPVPWFTLPEALEVAGRMFQAVVLLSGIPRYRSEQALRGIPEQISRDNLAAIELWARNYRERFGKWGLDRGSWPTNHLCCRLVRMERLEFGLSHFHFGFTLLRQRTGERQVLALAESGLRLRQDGRFHAAQGTSITDPGWETQLLCGGNVITGCPVVAPNVVSRQPVSLDPAEWEVVLKAGDPVLDVHIPARGRLDPTACDDSFARALAFFPRCFPEHVFKAFTCCSWLVDPQFVQQMPGSNMAAFTQRFHHMPHANANDDQIYELGLGGRRPLDQLPRDTSLRRTLVAHLENGGQWSCSNGVVLREEVDSNPARIRRLPGY